jgi:hypothetical protein
MSGNVRFVSAVSIRGFIPVDLQLRQPSSGDRRQAKMSITVDARNDTPQPGDASRWATLCQELIEAFPTLTERDVIQMVASARSSTDLFGLDPAEQISATAMIARNNLELLVNGNDLARLDPETRARRTRDT